MADPKTREPEAGNEIAVAYGNLDITRNFLNADGTLSNDDTVLMQQGLGDFRVYTDLLRDDQVKNSWEQRSSALVSANWSVQPGADDAASVTAAKFLEENLKRIGWDRVTERMLYSRLYGFGVAEIVWEIFEGKFAFKQIRVRNRERFEFTAGGRCYLRTAATANPASRIYCDAPNFWILESGSDHDDNPYGIGLGHQLYWPVRFKRDGIRFWLVYLEKFAQPTAVGKFKNGSSTGDRNNLLRALLAVATQTGVTIPEDMAIELLEAKRSGTADYAAVAGRMDAAIMKIIVGQTLTTEVGSTGGNRALGQTHMSVRQDIVKQDADLINETFNRGPVAWMMAANFPGAAPPIVTRELEESEDLSSLVDQLEKLDKMGFSPTIDFVQDRWGADIEQGERPQPPAFPPASNPLALPPGKTGKVENGPEATFAAVVSEIFSDQVALDGAMDAFGDRLGKLSEDRLAPFLRYAADHSPAEVMDAIHDALPGLKADQLQEALTRVLFVSMTWGRMSNAD